MSGQGKHSQSEGNRAGSLLKARQNERDEMEKKKAEIAKVRIARGDHRTFTFCPSLLTRLRFFSKPHTRCGHYCALRSKQHAVRVCKVRARSLMDAELQSNCLCVSFLERGVCIDSQ